MSHALMENRIGLIVGAFATHASGHAERLATRYLIETHSDRAQKDTLARDRGLRAELHR